MLKWVVELSKCDISYEPQGPIKAQVLADFIEFSSPASLEEDSTWILSVTGASNV